MPADFTGHKFQFLVYTDYKIVNLVGNGAGGFKLVTSFQFVSPRAYLYLYAVGEAEGLVSADSMIG